MLDGECIKEEFELLLSERVIRDLSSIGGGAECDYQIQAFCDPSGSLTSEEDRVRNDFHSHLLALNNRYEDLEMYLEKRTACGCDWEELTQLTDNTYGRFDVEPNPYWLNYRMEWLKVYNEHGLGCYRVRKQYKSILDAEIQLEYSYQFNVAIYDANKADEEVRYTYTINGGKIGDPYQDEEVLNFNEYVWDSQIRLTGIFGHSDSSEYEREYIKYRNGSKVWTKDAQVEKYKSILKGVPFFVHLEVSKIIFHSDEIIIDDFNLININEWRNKRVIPEGDYEPSYNVNTSFSSVELTFSQYYENLERKRC